MLSSSEAIWKQEDLIMRQAPQWHDTHPGAPYIAFAISVFDLYMALIYLVYC